MMYDVLERIAGSQTLERPAQVVADALRPVFQPASVKTALSGAWLGHRLHPMLTDVVIGALGCAAVLDAVGREDGQRSADTLVGLGLAAALPTVSAGWSDWTDVYGRSRRLGLVHATANVVAVGFYVASLGARRRGARGRGKTLSLLGLTTLAAGGYIGGHLSYVMGVGVDRTAFHDGPKEWTRVGSADDLVSDAPRVVAANGRELLFARVDGALVALDNTCSHAGCSLSSGEIAEGVVTCPCHGSRFRLADGSVARGPAASPQPRYEVRVRDDVVEVRAR